MSVKLNSIKSDKLFAWAKLLALTGSAQVVVQAIGFVSGILIIRLLQPSEYAFYILANTILGTMTVLADGGIGTGVMAQGAAVWQDKQKLGSVLATGINLRKKFAIFSILVSVPVLIYLLLHNGASLFTTIMICLALIPAFYAGLWDSILDIVPRLHQSVLPLQKNQVAVGIGRLVMQGLSLFVFPWAYVAILANGIPRLLGNIKLKKIAYEFADASAKPDPLVQTEILKIVKRYMPGAIYFSLSGQITLWLISVFGNTTAIAQIGALGRFSVILTLVITITGTLITPRFARLEKNKKRILKFYFQILSGLFLLMALIVGATVLFPKQILWILGGNYKDLQFELILCIAGSCLGVLSDIAFSLLTSRGWMYHPLVYIGVNILSIIFVALSLDITTVSGALGMTIIVNTVLLLMNIVIFIRSNYKS